MRRIIFVLILVLIALAVVFLLPGKEKDEKYCEIDKDCVAVQCCHPTDCVNKVNKSDCKGIICTEVCSPGTMDCGQGNCACIYNGCKAIIK